MERFNEHEYTILNSYLEFCNFMKLNANDYRSKQKFVNQYMGLSVTFFGLAHYDEIKKDVKKILRGKKFLTSHRKYKVLNLSHKILGGD